MLSTALAVAEAGLEEWEVTPAAAGVEMGEMGFSPISPVWPPGTAVAERAGHGTEPVAPAEQVVEEMQEVIPHGRDRTEQLTPVGAAEETDMPTARHQAKADRVL